MAHCTFTLVLSHSYLRTTCGFSERQILQVCLFKIQIMWKVDSSLKETSRKLLSLSIRMSMSTGNSFRRGQSSGSSAWTIWILYACNFKRRWRIFYTVVWGIWSSLLAWRMDFPGLLRDASRNLSAVSASTEGLPAPFPFETLSFSLNCSNHIPYAYVCAL